MQAAASGPLREPSYRTRKADNVSSSVRFLRFVHQIQQAIHNTGLRIAWLQTRGEDFEGVIAERSIVRNVPGTRHAVCQSDHHSLRETGLLLQPLCNQIEN